jgi:hypothetical protein
MTTLDPLLAHGIVPEKHFDGVVGRWYLPILVCFTFYSHVTQIKHTIALKRFLETIVE